MLTTDHTLVDAMPIGACIVSGDDLRIAAINEKMLSIWNKQDCLIGKTLKEAVPHFLEQKCYDLLIETYGTGQPSSSSEEDSDFSGPGECSYLNYSFTPLKDFSGKVHSVLATAIDVSNQVISRQKLQEAERRHGFMLHLSDALRPLEHAGTIQQEAARILGEFLGVSRVGYGDVDPLEQRWFKTEHNWTDGTVFSHHGTHDLAAFGPEIFAALRSGQHLIIDDMLVDPRTAHPEMQAAFHALQFRSVITISLIKEGRFVAALYVHDRNRRHWTEADVLLVQEVAERTWAAVQRAHAEKTLRNSEEKFRTLFNSIDEGFCIIEMLYENGKPIDFRFESTNPAFEISTGLQEVTGKTALGLLKQVDPFWLNKYDQVVRTGKPARFENYSQGTKRWYSVCASRVSEDTPQLAVVLDDITERKRSEQLKNDFISMVSHELKTPLTSLKAHLQVLNKNAENSENSFTANAVQRSLVQVSRMHKLIQGFLDVARLEEGKIYLNTESFDLYNLISENIEEFVLANNSHELTFHCDRAPLQIIADRDKIGQVIINLLGNAVKYSDPGSKVEVRCECDEKMVQVSISDTGIGINSKNLSRLFERFYRVDDEQIKHISGFGIGLYLCSEIVKYHQGEIGVDSEEGRGSTFWFRLPLA